MPYCMWYNKCIVLLDVHLCIHSISTSFSDDEDFEYPLQKFAFPSSPSPAAPEVVSISSDAVHPEVTITCMPCCMHRNLCITF